ncbi:MAG: hypothetical protein AMJ92_10705 [candidate division Zixibacteria bacterium SM23_81]|nr:MAG: hypothetical protein AMJ92_10705 [candidate division Zixibacteria bacterium SM23_81]
MKKAAFLLAIFSLSVFTAQFALAGDYADYGDAPDPPYCSLFESDGARHINSEAIYEWLGENVDLEFNSHQVNNDLYDDGVVFNTPYWPGDTCSVDVTISVSQWDGGRYPPNLYLDAWFDWNRDNDWDDAGENAICGYSIDPSTWDGNTKTYNITFPVPSYATNLSFIWARFRLHYSSTLNQYCQQSPYGEVEDHRLEVPVHDVGVHAIVPGYEMVGHSDIAATVRNYGANDETGIDLYWMTDTGDSGATTIDTLLSQQEKDVNLGWTPDTTGLVSLTAWTDLAGDENAFNDTTSRSAVILHRCSRLLRLYLRCGGEGYRRRRRSRSYGDAEL